MASLGNTTKSAAATSEQGVAAKYHERFSLLHAAQDLLRRDNHRTCMCCKSPNPMSTSELGVWANPAENQASWGGLMKCGNIWTCPICNGRITEERREELRHAVDGAKSLGWGMGLLTLTLQHNQKQGCRDVLLQLRGALSKLVASRSWKSWKMDNGVTGSIRAVEVTRGENGWHWHAHMLIFFASPEQAEYEVSDAFRKAWQRHVESVGGFASLEHGVDYRYESNHAGGNYVAEYVAKFGKLPEGESAHDVAWGESSELTKANSKVARSKEGISAFGLLASWLQGDTKAGALFVEYSRAVKGQQHLVWSNGLKDKLLQADEKLTQNDEILADALTGELVLPVTERQFRTIQWQRQQGALLDTALRGGVSAAQAHLARLERAIDDNFQTVRTGTIGYCKYSIQYAKNTDSYRAAVWAKGDNTGRPLWRSGNVYKSESVAVFYASKAAHTLQKRSEG